MYGTVARMKTKPGVGPELMRIGELFNQMVPDVPGYIGEYVYQLDSDENTYMMAVIFQDRESYHANAADPRTHEFSQKMRDLLDADPEWNDGEIVYSSMKATA